MPVRFPLSQFYAALFHVSCSISSNVDFLPMTGVPEVMEEDEADENGSEGVKKRPRGSANLLNITARRMSGRSNRMSSIGEESDIGFGRKSKRSGEQDGCG